ncbi:LOW QUALITY PROTEIN: albumin [Callospermophilus lateralis]
MKWVTFISLLFLFSSAYSRGVFREVDKSEIITRFKGLGEQHFKGLVLLTFSQYLQKTAYDDLAKFTTEVTDLAKACVADDSGADCNKPLDTIFGEKTCTIATLCDTYGEMADCCNKQDVERYHCLVKFLYEISRRHPYFSGPELIYFAEKFKDYLTECCPAADKGECLTPKCMRKIILLFSAKYKFKCSIIEKSGERAFKAWEVAHLSQRFPKADFTDITKMAADLNKIHMESCKDDQIEAHDRVTLFKYICDNQDTVSKKVGERCAKQELERFHCIAELEEDDKPVDFPSVTADFAEDKDVCKNYAEAKDIFLGTFVYEYSRRHPEYGSLLLLRIAKAYEAKLEKCCAEADPPACYGNVFVEFEPLVTEPQNIVKQSCDLYKQSCDLYEQVGEYKFQNGLLICYTKTPQVSTPTLVEASRDLGRVSHKCCKLSEKHRMPCIEDYLSAVLNSVCVMHEKNPVRRVTKCCSESFLNKWICLSALQVDDTYAPKEFNAETFTFHADICTLLETEQQIKKQIALAELVKHKPTATMDQLKTMIGDFGAFLEKCCKADDKEACFSEEGPKLVAASKAALA